MSSINYSYLSSSSDSDSDECESFVGATEKYEQIKAFLKQEFRKEFLCKYDFWVFYRRIENILPNPSLLKQKTFLEKAVATYEKLLEAYLKYKEDLKTPYNSELFEIFYTEIKNLTEPNGRLSYTFPFTVSLIHCDLVYALDYCGGKSPSKVGYHSEFDF